MPSVSGQPRNYRSGLQSHSLFWRITALKWLLVLVLCLVVSYVRAGPVPGPVQSLAPALSLDLLPVESDPTAVSDSLLLLSKKKAPALQQPAASIIRSTLLVLLYFLIANLRGTQEIF